MKKIKLLLAALLLGMMALTSCGIFGKGCGCPKFGHVEITNPAVKTYFG